MSYETTYVLEKHRIRDLTISAAVTVEGENEIRWPLVTVFDLTSDGNAIMEIYLTNDDRDNIVEALYKESKIIRTPLLTSQ